jgi:hypothetical protein
VLKGRFEGKNLIFYYYQVTGTAWNGPEPNMISPGERDIFYLLQDQGVWRAATDLFVSHTRIVSGIHLIPPSFNEDQVSETIGRLLLEPSNGVDQPAFLGSLHRNSAIAIGLVGKANASEMLQRLLTSPNPEIRGRACIVLAEFPLNEKNCLPTIVRDVDILADDRKRAEELMRSN